MSDYESLDHMEVAKLPGKYFIPHQAVLKVDGELLILRWTLSPQFYKHFFFLYHNTVHSLLFLN